MGRSLTSAEAIPSVGETWASRAPRIYYLHPQNVGGQPEMARHITLAAELGFDHICLGPIFEPGRGDPFLISDLDRADPRLGIAGSPENAVREIAALCRGQGLATVSRHRARPVGRRRSQRAAGLTAFMKATILATSSILVRIAPRSMHATLRPGATSRLVAWWTDRLVRLVRAGASGFRLVGLDPVPGDAVRQIVGATRSQASCGFWGWTPGVNWARHADLIGAGLDGVFASTAWWDGRADWYVAEYEFAPPRRAGDRPCRGAAADRAAGHRPAPTRAQAGCNHRWRIHDAGRLREGPRGGGQGRRPRKPNAWRRSTRWEKCAGSRALRPTSPFWRGSTPPTVARRRTALSP